MIMKSFFTLFTIFLFIRLLVNFSTLLNFAGCFTSMNIDICPFFSLAEWSACSTVAVCRQITSSLTRVCPENHSNSSSAKEKSSRYIYYFFQKPEIVKLELMFKSKKEIDKCYLIRKIDRCL